MKNLLTLFVLIYTGASYAIPDQEVRESSVVKSIFYQDYQNEFLQKQSELQAAFGNPTSSHHTPLALYPVNEVSVTAYLMSQQVPAPMGHTAFDENVANCPGFISNSTPSTSTIANYAYFEHLPNQINLSLTVKEHCLHYDLNEYTFIPAKQECKVKTRRSHLCFTEVL